MFNRPGKEKAGKNKERVAQKKKYPYINSSIIDAGIAQLVEHNLAKVGVASSSLVSRSRTHKASDTLQRLFCFQRSPPA